MESLVPVYEALWAAGAPHGIRDFGMYAMDSLRLEKCYRGWKSDMTHEYTPLMASLDRFVDFQKPEFKGMAALAEESRRGPKERLVPLVLDEAGDADAPSCAAVWQNGTRSGSSPPAMLRHRPQHRARLCAQRSARRYAAGSDPGRTPAAVVAGAVWIRTTHG
jgi:dimethylglycine dehydrogenase